MGLIFISIMTNDIEHLLYVYWQFFFCIIVFKENFGFETEKNLVASIFFLFPGVFAVCHSQLTVHWGDAAKAEMQKEALC